MTVSEPHIRHKTLLEKTEKNRPFRDGTWFANALAPDGRQTRSHRRPRTQKEIAMNVSSIAPLALAELCKGDGKIDLLDVRTPVEFRELHAAGARNIPLDQLDPAIVMQARNGAGNKPLYVICRSGSRGRQACEKFVQAGYPNVVNVEGGTLAWAECGLPVVRGKKTISLERQVRIAAGLLMLLGSLLGWLVHPIFIALSAFVGGGLVYAGVTDTCGMGLLMARMPWNRVKEAARPCCTTKEGCP
jgi:rhodanese-related sulfurtransferase